MDVAPDRRWSPRPLPSPVRPAPSASPAPEAQTLVPGREEQAEAPDPVILPLTGAFLLLVAGLLAHQARPIVVGRLPLRR